MRLFQKYIYLLFLVLVSAMTPMLTAQTFRGGIAGTVQDSSGAAVSNAKISLLGTETGYKRDMVSTDSGDVQLPGSALGRLHR